MGFCDVEKKIINKILMQYHYAPILLSDFDFMNSFILLSWLDCSNWSKCYRLQVLKYTLKEQHYTKFQLHIILFLSFLFFQHYTWLLDCIIFFPHVFFCLWRCSFLLIIELGLCSVFNEHTLVLILYKVKQPTHVQ